MVRLMCSKDRQELKGLDSELCRAGIQHEIRGNPLTAALGITRFEIHVDQADLPAAAKIWRELAAAGGAQNVPRDLQGTSGINGFIEQAQSELVVDAKMITDPATESPRDDDPGRQPETGRSEPKSDLAQVTASLEDEVKALLASESELVNRCSVLEEKVKALDEALEHSRTELAREVANRSDAEKKLAEVGEGRASLEKEMQALALRLKTSEQALATAQSRLESQAQQREQLMKQRSEEQLQAQAYVGTVNDLRSQIRARLAAREKKDFSSPEKPKRRPVAEKDQTSSRQAAL
jgi:hypothetical protein